MMKTPILILGPGDRVTGDVRCVSVLTPTGHLLNDVMDGFKLHVDECVTTFPQGAEADERVTFYGVREVILNRRSSR